MNTFSYTNYSTFPHVCVIYIPVQSSRDRLTTHYRVPSTPSLKLQASSRSDTPTGSIQRLLTVRFVGICGQLNKCPVLCSSRLQRGHKLDGLFCESILFLYCIRNGLFPVLN